MNTEEIKTAYAKLTADLIDEGHEVLDIARALFAHNTAIQSELETTGTVKSPNASASDGSFYCSFCFIRKYSRKPKRTSDDGGYFDNWYG